MGPSTPAEVECLLRVVRGELPLAALAAIGITVQFQGGRCRVDNPKKLTANAGVPDLARGILSQRHDAAAFRDWALFIQAADIEVDAARHPAEQVVRDALWAGSFLVPLGPDTVAALECAVRDST